MFHVLSLSPLLSCRFILVIIIYKYIIHKYVVQFYIPDMCLKVGSSKIYLFCHNYIDLFIITEVSVIFTVTKGHITLHTAVDGSGNHC